MARSSYSNAIATGLVSGSTAQRSSNSLATMRFHAAFTANPYGGEFAGPVFPANSSRRSIDEVNP